MLFDLVEALQKKRRLIYIVAFIVFDLWLLTFCTQILQTHRSGITSRIQNTETSLAQRDQRDAFARNDMFERIDRATSTAEINILRATIGAADAVTKTERNLQTAAKASLAAIQTAAITTVRGIGAACMMTARGISAIVSHTARAIGHSVVFVGKVIAFPFIALGTGVGHVFGAASGFANSQLTSVIRPHKNTDAPVITPEQAQQATLIQENTQAVKPMKPSGSGGACDNGAGNGGYPMEWCDARMDTIRTVAYSNDRINRQCTSYAYWYFTTVGGHSDFRVTGNANRWARTSNYPVHQTPAVGAIAVQTAGVYGHVAIVQALPGEMYEGRIVPEGHVLVSEMNYDWQGHFRYSYSPLSKFSSYIYP